MKPKYNTSLLLQMAITNELGWGSEREFKFHPTRKWRFDLALEPQKIAVEIEGGLWLRGRHNRGVGYIKDMEKYNEAVKLGWRILRYTPQNYLNAINDIKEMTK